MDDEWTVVKGGKGGRSHGQGLKKVAKLTKGSEGMFQHARDEAGDKERASRLQETIQMMQTEIRTSLVCKSLEAALSQAQLTHSTGSNLGMEELVIYGLGSMDNSVVSRWQLALALTLRHLLTSHDKAPIKTSSYDPAFGPCDLLLMRSLGIEVIEENEECRRLAHAPTFFYMPHCEHHLYESLVIHNLSSGLLSNVIILGNSFKRYGESLNGSKPKQIMDLVARGCIDEIDVPCDKGPKKSRDNEPPYPEGAFNNTSLHFFKEYKVVTRPNAAFERGEA